MFRIRVFYALTGVAVIVVFGSFMTFENAFIHPITVIVASNSSAGSVLNHPNRIKDYISTLRPDDSSGLTGSLDGRGTSSKPDDRNPDTGAICRDLHNVHSMSEAYSRVDDWQTVTDDVLYVYSAHADPRQTRQTTIRVFGVMLRTAMSNKNRKPYYCQIYTSRSPTVYVVQAQLRTITGHNTSKLRMIAFGCHYPDDAWSLPQMIVSIVTEKCTQSNNHLVVRQNYRNGFQTNFTLCLHGVLKHDISDSARLVEWVELNALLGAEHIFVYNFSGSAQLNPYLEYYERRGLLTVLPWTLPIKFREDEPEFDNDFLILWNYGQRTMMHDCLYRNMFVARNLVYLDLDEFIIPQQDDVWTWQELIARASSNCSADVGSYSARNGIFFINGTHQHGLQLGAVTPVFTTMKTKIRHAFSRSKYILIPQTVLFLNVHFVEEYYNRSYSPCVLDTSVGHLHHYKPIWSEKSKQENMAAVKFKDQLFKRMHRVYEDLVL